MRRSSRFVSGALGLLAIVAAAGRPTSSEVQRLRTHFSTVEQELLARDVSALTPAQQSARAEQIDVLRRYSARGVFPKNRDFPGQVVPYFRDADSTLCAMAFLIAESGHQDLVDHVAETRNNAFIPELVDEPGLAEWLDQHGLAAAEAARIQPTYGDDVPPNISGPFVLASFTTSLVSSGTIVANARSTDRIQGNRWLGVLGAVAGATNIVLGLVKLDVPDAGPKVFAGVNLAIGATALALGVRRLRVQQRTSASGDARLQVFPVATAGRSPRLGFEARVRF